jgi:hypothetical protein
MIIEVTGKIYKTGEIPAKDGKPAKKVINLLVDRTDGQMDSFTIFTEKEHKPGSVFKGKVNIYVQMGNEVI